MSRIAETRAKSALISNGSRQRFTHGVSCPVCGGCENDPRGEGKRCFGFIYGDWVHCTREDHSAGCKFDAGSSTYSHRLKGKCSCGTEHNPADPPASKKPSQFGEIERVYKYHDENGVVVFEVVRFKNPKDFRQRKPGQKKGWSIAGIKTVLYHLPLILHADPDQPVHIVEGEKDVENLEAKGRLATCNPMGAGKWIDHYAECLVDRHCIIIPDNDQAGRDHAQQVAQSLHDKAASVKVVELPGLPPKGDVSDFLNAGGSVDQLDELARKTARWAPPGDEPIVNKDGIWVSCQLNSRIWLTRRRLAGKIRYDRFQRMIFIDGESLDDETVIRLTGEIERHIRTRWNQEHVRSAIIDIGYENQYSSLTDWLDSLKWDSVPRLDRFFETAYGCKDSAYSAACSKVLFLSAAARAYDPGCKADVMIVEIGRQGIGKSKGISELCPVAAWHTDDGIGNLSDRKATGEGLQGKWLVEFSEFTRINRATVETIKSFVTRQFDHYRPSYGRTSKDFPRSCVFIGTTNEKHPLHDVENRRFMPIRVGQGNIKWIADNRDQLWAEAVVRYRAGELWWVTDPGLIKECEKQQEAARLDDAWESILANGLVGLDRTDMEKASKILGVEVGRLDKSTQTRIGIALEKLRFRRRRVRVGKDRSYIWERSPVPTSDPPF